MCDACDACGHSEACCRAFKGKRRGQLYWVTEGSHADAAQPSAQELAKHKQASCIPDIVMKAQVEHIDGSGLMCFYLNMIAALARLPRVRKHAPKDASSLIRLLSDFLITTAAPGLVQTLSGHSLEQIAQSAGMTMKMLAARVRRAGTVAGLGGTEMGVALSGMFNIHIFYWQPLRGNEFKLVDLQRTTAKPLGLVHAEWIPVNCITARAYSTIAHLTGKTRIPFASYIQGRDSASSHFNLLVPIGEMPMVALTMGLQVSVGMPSPLARWVGRGRGWVE